MKRHAALILMLGTLSLFGCKKKDSDAPAPAVKEPAPTPAPTPPAGSGSAPAATPPAPAAGGCDAGAYKDPAGVYCVTLPEGVKPPKKARATGKTADDTFDSDDTFIITVNDDPAVTFDYYKKEYAKSGDGVVVTASGDYDGGNGFYMVGKNDAKKEVDTASVVKSGTKVITCQGVSFADKPFKPADACKTLHAM